MCYYNDTDLITNLKVSDRYQFEYFIKNLIEMSVIVCVSHQATKAGQNTNTDVAENLLLSNKSLVELTDILIQVVRLSSFMKIWPP